MADQRAKGGEQREPLWIDLTFEDAGDRGGTLEFGLQDARGELDAGTPGGDGAVRFVTEITLRRQPDGSARYSGAHVHGPTRERFLYVSFRLPGAGADWRRRVKIPLPGSVEAGVRGLRGRWRDRGTPRAEPVGEGWQADTAERL